MTAVDLLQPLEEQFLLNCRTHVGCHYLSKAGFQMTACWTLQAM